MNVYESYPLRKPIKVPIAIGLFWVLVLKMYCMLYWSMNSSVKLTSWKMASYHSKQYVKSSGQKDAKNCKRLDLFLFSSNVSLITRTLSRVTIQMRRNQMITKTCWHLIWQLTIYAVLISWLISISTFQFNYVKSTIRVKY